MAPPPDLAGWRRHLLWIDGAAGATVGVPVLLVAEWLAGWTGLPLGLVRGMGAANLAYGAYALALASRRRRSLRPVAVLVVANLTWAVLCFRWAALHADTATWLGMAQLVGEGLFVGGLAVVEWRSRRWLVSDGTATARPVR